MIIDKDIGYVQRQLEGKQTDIESLALQYKRLSDKIDCLQKDERDLFGELLKLESCLNWRNCLTGMESKLGETFLITRSGGLISFVTIMNNGYTPRKTSTKW